MVNPSLYEAQADATAIDQFPARLKQAVGNNSVRGFARECGFSDTVLRQYLNGQSEPTRPALLAIARTAKVSVEWLATGLSMTGVTTPDKGDAQQYVYQEPLAFETGWLQAKFPNAFEHLMLTQIVDDSMEPTLPVGSLVLVNTTDRDWDTVAHGIYLIKFDDRIVVKRLQYVTDQTIRVLSDNTAYETFSVTLPNQASLMGRVVWVGHSV